MKLALVSLLLLCAACATPDGDTPAAQREYAENVMAEALAELYERNPEAQDEIAAAPGYFFLSGFSIHPGLMSIANGYGIVVNNETGDHSHSRLFRFAIGPGIAVKGYYVVAIADTPEAVAALAEGRSVWGALAEASFNFGDFGGSAAAEGASGGLHTYLWTHTGVALELDLAWANVYQQDELNAVPESDDGGS